MLNIKNRCQWTGSRIMFIIFLLASLSSKAGAQTTLNDPWKSGELMPASQLAALINSNKKPLIFNLGPIDNIKGAIKIGPSSEKSNLEKLKTAIAKIPKNSLIVIYCGCCPMEKCPNIRPGFKLMKDMKFTNFFLLELPTNLRTDWVAKGYPIEK